MRYGFMVAGMVLLAVSAWFVIAGFSIDTTVSGADGTNIANLQLMHLQLTDVVIGVAAGIASCVLFVGAAIVAAIEDATAAQK